LFGTHKFFPYESSYMYGSILPLPVNLIMRNLLLNFPMALQEAGDLG